MRRAKSYPIKYSLINQDIKFRPLYPKMLCPFSMLLLVYSRKVDFSLDPSNVRIMYVFSLYKNNLGYFDWPEGPPALLGPFDLHNFVLQ